MAMSFGMPSQKAKQGITFLGVQKSMETISEIEELKKRIAYLEIPWYKRMWMRIRENE